MIPNELLTLPDNPAFESAFTDEELQDIEDAEGEWKFTTDREEQINK